MFSPNVDSLHDYRKEKRKGRVTFTKRKENSLMLIVFVVVDISRGTLGDDPHAYLFLLSVL